MEPVAGGQLLDAEQSCGGSAPGQPAKIWFGIKGRPQGTQRGDGSDILPAAQTRCFTQSTNRIFQHYLLKYGQRIDYLQLYINVHQVQKYDFTVYHETFRADFY